MVGVECLEVLSDIDFLLLHFKTNFREIKKLSVKWKMHQLFLKSTKTGIDQPEFASRNSILKL